MTTDEHIQQNQRRRFEVMAVRLANHLDLSGVEVFDQLPAQVKTMFNGLKYIEIVLPLMQNDRDRFQMSFRQLSIKYGVPKSTIHGLTQTRKLR